MSGFEKLDEVVDWADAAGATGKGGANALEVAVIAIDGDMPGRQVWVLNHRMRGMPPSPFCVAQLYGPGGKVLVIDRDCPEEWQTELACVLFNARHGHKWPEPTHTVKYAFGSMAFIPVEASK